jgi:signal transduction histidine kinase
MNNSKKFTLNNPGKVIIKPHWFRNINIVNKLYFVVGVMALLIAMELFILVFSINTLSSVRSYVGAEGLWSKAQKDANYSLQKFALTGKEEYYQEFLNNLKIPLGDRVVRLEMSKENPDYSIMRKGFLAGGVHPDDIDGMISLFLRFHSISYINKAINVWTEGDSLMSRFVIFADELHKDLMRSGSLSPSTAEQYINQIDEYNAKFTMLENKFSSTLGEGSRWLESIILKILLTIALTVEISGLVLTIVISRNISRGIGQILNASQQIGLGNYQARAEVYSQDEIGELATSFNTMAIQLEQSIDEKEKRAAELSIANKELLAFTYISSHDLQEPLRKIQIFADRILEKENENLTATGKQHFERIRAAANRMQQLIEDLLAFSRINTTELKFIKTDLNSIVDEVLAELSESIYENHATIETNLACVVNIIPFQFRQLLYNLISNAIKFSKPDRPPHIVISCKIAKGNKLNNEKLIPDEDYCHLQVRDNGIGFEKEFSERIFEVFQKLHTKEEYPGTGIGLAIVKKIVLIHDGIITATSEPDKGSTFDIYLPVT